MNLSEGYYCSKVVANKLGCDRTTINRWCNNGKIKFEKRDRNIYVSLEECMKYYEIKGKKIKQKEEINKRFIVYLSSCSELDEKQKELLSKHFLNYEIMEEDDLFSYERPIKLAELVKLCKMKEIQCIIMKTSWKNGSSILLLEEATEVDIVYLDKPQSTEYKKYIHN
jgi:hypothetical protein